MLNITDETADFNGPDLMFVDHKNNRAFVIDIAVFLTHKLSNIEARKVTIYESLALK